MAQDNKEHLSTASEADKAKQAPKSAVDTTQQVKEQQEAKKQADIGERLTGVQQGIEQKVAQEEQETEVTTGVAEELGAHKTEVGGSLWDKAQAMGGKGLQRMKDNRGKLALGTSALGVGYGIKKVRDYFKSDSKAETSQPEATNTSTTTKTGENITINMPQQKQPEPSLLQKAMPWIFGGTAVAGVAGAGYLFRDSLYKLPIVGPWLKNIFKKDLSMQSAISYVRGNLVNASEAHFQTGVDLDYDENKKVIKAFGHEMQIDEDNKTIKGLNISFDNFEDMVSTAVIICAAKHTYKGKCGVEAPFSISSRGGDIEAKLIDDTDDLASGLGVPAGTITGGAVGSLLALGAGYLGGIKLGAYTAIGSIPGFMALGSATIDKNNTIAQIAPPLNEEINKKELVAFLNKQEGWVAARIENYEDRVHINGDEGKETTKTNELIKKQCTETLKKIANKSAGDAKDKPKETYRDPMVETLPGHENILKVHAYNKDVYIQTELEGDKVKSIKVEDTDIVFTGEEAVSQSLHLALFIAQAERELVGKGDKKEAFSYEDGMIVSGLGKKGIYFDEPNKAYQGEYKLSKEAIERDMPELSIEKINEKLIPWLNGRVDENGNRLWVSNSGGHRKNTYLEAIESKKTA